MEKEKFLSKTKRKGECLIWLGAKQPNGYGHLGVAGKTKLAHRHSYELFVGEAGKLQVNHRCDTRLCVEPKHLWLGTQKENIRDAAAKNRLEPRAHARGERHGLAKLDWGSVQAIRALHAEGRSIYSLAKKFGVGETTVSAVVKRETWR